MIDTHVLKDAADGTASPLEAIVHRIRLLLEKGLGHWVNAVAYADESN